MNKENTEFLYENYPNLYQGLCAPISESNMAFGLECGDGWFKLINELSAKLEPLGVVASQVKEKYGTLCFYLRNGTNEAYDLVEEAEADSGAVCELCGEPGKIRGVGWIFTRCDKCNEEKNK